MTEYLTRADYDVDRMRPRPALERVMARAENHKGPERLTVSRKEFEQLWYELWFVEPALFYDFDGGPLTTADGEPKLDWTRFVRVSKHFCQKTDDNAKNLMVRGTPVFVKDVDG